MPPGRCRHGVQDSRQAPGADAPQPILRVHNLRHSYASWLVSTGASLKQVGKLLGHSQERSTQRYSHIADRALRDATNAFGHSVSLKWIS